MGPQACEHTVLRARGVESRKSVPGGRTPCLVGHLGVLPDDQFESSPNLDICRFILCWEPPSSSVLCEIAEVPFTEGPAGTPGIPPVPGPMVRRAGRGSHLVNLFLGYSGLTEGLGDFGF